MRTLKLSLLLLVAALVCGSPAVARTHRHPHKPRPHCAVPSGWHVVTSGAEAVVIKSNANRPRPGGFGSGPEFRYCPRHVGTFRLLTRTDVYNYPPPAGDPNEAFDISVAGHYLAYAVISSDKQAGYLQARLVDVTTARTVVVPDPTSSGCCTDLGLSPTGVVAGLAFIPAPGYQTAGNSDVLVYSAGKTTVLDTAKEGDLADVQLYQCASGCAPNTTVVAWTHSGAWRYARVN